MNPNLSDLLAQTDRVMSGSNGWHTDPTLGRPSVHVGVDLGTAYTVLVVLDANHQPIAGAYQFAQIVRDGLVVDFVGAVDLLRRLKSQVEQQLGFTLS
ncbi:MAG TPA: ethanolamine utilization protein EutJ, partial [Anaerolineales bacterium]